MRTIAIIGGGLSGTLAAVNLLDTPSLRNARVLLIERSGRFGPGVAYGTDSPRHFLNLPAAAMSAFFDRPDHFLNWVRLLHPGIGPRSFLPRAMYGAYLQSILEDAGRRAGNEGRFEKLAATVVRLRREGDGFEIGTEGAGDIFADMVVLALGNFPPRIPDGAHSLARSGRLVGNPWANGALAAIERDAPVLFLGAGLTMIDCAVELDALGHRGLMVAWSRSGTLPRVWRESDSAPAGHPVVSRGTAVSSPGFVRLPRSFGDGFRAPLRLRGLGVGDSGVRGLRGLAPAGVRRTLIARVGPAIRRYRHRVPPATFAQVSRLIERGRLTLHAGAFFGLVETADGVRAAFRRGRFRQPVNIQAAYLVNCSGPARDVRRMTDPLVRSLVEGGLVRPDAVRWGFDCTTRGNLVGATGRVAKNLFAIGPLRAGGPWTADAAPRIRVQAAGLGAAIAG